MTADWRRLADYVVRRRAQLGLTQSQLAQAGPLSIDRVQSVEGAKRESYRISTLVALERALQWEPGSIDLILAGGSPTPVGELARIRQETPEQRLDRLYREWKALDPDGLRERLEPGPPGRDIA